MRAIVFVVHVILALSVACGGQQNETSAKMAQPAHKQLMIPGPVEFDEAVLAAAGKLWMNCANKTRCLLPPVVVVIYAPHGSS